MPDDFNIVAEVIDIMKKESKCGEVYGQIFLSLISNVLILFTKNRVSKWSFILCG